MDIRQLGIWNILAMAFCFAAATTATKATITVDVVQVGNAGNADDSTGFGGVAYEYAIGKYEVTIGQYTSFLNAVAATDTYGLYNTALGTHLNIAGITRSGTSGSFSYAVNDNSGSSANRPVSFVTWFQAARFANWMANGQTTGAQNANTTERGAYTLNGAISGVGFAKTAINPNTGTTTAWWIPSEDEWYKAAYYDPTVGAGGGDNYWLYPTQSNSTPGNVVGSAPNQANYHTSVFSVTQSGTYSGSQNYLTAVGSFTGSGSFYGTYDQAGGVWEWTDGVISSQRVLRGGSWDSNDDQTNLQATNYTTNYPNQTTVATSGFRLASVPEPATTILIFMAGAGFLGWKRWRSGI